MSRTILVRNGRGHVLEVLVKQVVRNPSFRVRWPSDGLALELGFKDEFGEQRIFPRGAENIVFLLHPWGMGVDTLEDQLQVHLRLSDVRHGAVEPLPAQIHGGFDPLLARPPLP